MAQLVLILPLDCPSNLMSFSASVNVHLPVHSGKPFLLYLSGFGRNIVEIKFRYRDVTCSLNFMGVTKLSVSTKEISSWIRCKYTTKRLGVHRYGQIYHIHCTGR